MKVGMKKKSGKHLTVQLLERREKSNCAVTKLSLVDHIGKILMGL